MLFDYVPAYKTVSQISVGKNFHGRLTFHLCILTSFLRTERYHYLIKRKENIFQRILWHHLIKANFHQSFHFYEFETFMN